MTTASNSTATTPCGFTLDELRVVISTKWQLPEESKQFLGAYFLRKWHSANCKALIKDGCINYEGHRYQVRWIGGKVAATSNEYCFLSFRRPSSSSIHPTVLINKENY